MTNRRARPRGRTFAPISLIAETARWRHLDRFGKASSVWCLRGSDPDSSQGLFEMQNLVCLHAHSVSRTEALLLRWSSLTVAQRRIVDAALPRPRA